jgi:hypothetical protein
VGHVARMGRGKMQPDLFSNLELYVENVFRLLSMGNSMCVKHDTLARLHCEVCKLPENSFL